MSPTAAALLGFAAWSIVLLLALVGFRSVISLRGKSANSFKPSGEDLPGLPYRLARAHANCYENLAAAGVVMLYAITNDQTAVTDPFAYAFLGARIAQSLIHIVSTANPMVLVRFTFFLAQQLILIFWLLRFFGEFAA